MHSKVKSEQYFAVTSAKRVAVFQASLQLVGEEARSHLSNKDNKHFTSYGSKFLCKGGIVNKIYTLI